MSKIQLWTAKIAATAAALLLLGSPAYSYLADRSPISKVERSAKFPLAYVCSSASVQRESKVVGSMEFVSKKPAGRSGELYEGCNFRANNTSFSIKKDEIFIKGTNHKGESWEVILPVITMKPDPLECTIYTADIDKNGEKDLLIWRTTGSCGKMPPQSHFTSVMFDKLGNPNVWEIGGFFELSKNKKSIEELLQIKPNSNAVLISEQCDYRFYPNEARTEMFYDSEPELWKTILYEAKDATWNLIPEYGPKRMPLITPFATNNPPRKGQPVSRLIKENAFRNFENGSNAKNRIVSDKLLEFRYFFPENSKDLEKPLCFRTGQQEFTGGDEYGEGFVVTDQGRTWVSFGAKKAKQLMKSEASKQATIRFLKSPTPGDLPLIIWLD